MGQKAKGSSIGTIEENSPVAQQTSYYINY